MSHYRPALSETKRLLQDWANLPDLSKDWLDSMLNRHPRTFHCFRDDRKALREVIETVRRFLHLAWKSNVARERDWWLFTARQEYARGLLGTFRLLTRNAGGQRVFTSGGEDSRKIARRYTMGVPPETAFDRAAEILKRMAYCDGPDCEEPFFLRGPKRERYCPTCKPDARKRRRKRYYYSKEKFNRKPKARASS
jgi:hypothetical protein